MTDPIKDAQDTNFEFTTFEVTRNHMSIGGQVAPVEQITSVSAQTDNMMDAIKDCSASCSVYQRHGVDANGLVVWKQIYIGNQ
jgi:hypothetical protein